MKTALLMLALVAPLSGQTNEWGIWGSISFDAPTLLGQTADAKFANIGLRYGHVLATNKTMSLEWTIDAIPFATLSNNRFMPTASPFIFGVSRKRIYALGCAPIGLKF